MDFGYLLEKIKAQDFSLEPFKHIEINNFFSEAHFAELLKSKAVRLDRASDDRDLMRLLNAAGFEPISFPGTTLEEKAYIAWHAGGGKHDNLDTCEGFGMTFRLTSHECQLVKEIDAYFASPEFLGGVADKFGVELDACYNEHGLQKYLDGYEISPHPDIRRKALTYMINVNPQPDSQSGNYHTHYMKFEPSKEYVREFWRGNAGVDRCWVPWDWCQTVKQQTENNSIVLFSPADDTMHAVRAKYEHLDYQRTQFYGNLWYEVPPVTEKPAWHDFVVTATAEKRALILTPKAVARAALRRARALVRGS